MGDTLNDTENREAPRIGLAPAGGSDHPNAGRRRMLLRAGAVVPSVLTLSSGASAAVTSNLRCWANPATTPQRWTSADDTWYRKQVYDGSSQSYTVHCIMNPQSGCTDGSNTAPSGSLWIRDDGVTKVTAGSGTQVTSVHQGTYGLIYVDQDGQMVTLDPTLPGYQPVHDSCATSMGAAVINSLLG